MKKHTKTSLFFSVTFIITISLNTSTHAMHDPCKDAKKYGTGAVVSSGMTYGLWKKWEGVWKRDRHTCPMSRKPNCFGLLPCAMAGISYTLAVIAIKESYNCYQFSKRQEE